ncbi:hypothetical protein [Granulicella paludicola]|uniref:hypothetical protein n=1 Tax=Granulicella paludicola TaxID=474951 RepID=UPI0021E00634|nr:hypothetical protein [Granulicella paludicola]
MSTRILSAGKFTKVLYGGPEKQDIKIKFEASGLTDVYGVSAAFLENFRSDRTADLFTYLQKTKLNKTMHLKPALGLDWYLIMENRSQEPIAIHYEVFDV